MEEAEELDYQIYREYEILEKVGKGTYGIVYKAQHKKSKRILAIKKIIDAFQNLIDAKRTYRELNYLLQLEHPSIVHLEYLLSTTRRPDKHQPSTTRLVSPPHELRGCNTDKLAQNPYLQQRHVYAMFEFVETDLRVALKRCSQLQSIQRKFIGYQLLHGIAYLHRSGLIHRDIKPQNILLNCNKLELKICDFGMARLQASSAANEGVLTEYVASRWYRPPQALLGITTCQPAIDLWSVGCVLAELALKAPLFPGKSTLDQLQLILRAIGMPSSPEIEKLQSESAQYVLKNFAFSRKARFKPLQETLSMCSNAQIDLIISLLRFDPNERISSEQALKHQYFDEVRGVNQELEAFTFAKASLKDFSEKTLREKGQIPDIEHYRSLIEQLERFAEKSTNRSAPVNKEGILGQPFNTMGEVGERESEFKEKSTKESNFVIQNKQHFLSKTQQFQKINQEIKYEKEHVQSSNGLKNYKPDTSIKKDDLKKQKKFDSQHSQVVKDKSQNQKLKKSKPKIDKQVSKEMKVRQPSNEKKMLKTEMFDREFSLKNIKHAKSRSSKEMGDKGGKKSPQLSYNQPKQKLKLKDNVSMLSNNSKMSSNGNKSRDKSFTKPQKSPYQAHMTTKEQITKKMIKKSLIQNKSGLVKCKSVNHANLFKK